MQMIKFLSHTILIYLSIWTGTVLAQGRQVRLSVDSTRYYAAIDSIKCVQDSLEVVLLTTSQTYAHIEEILQCIPVESSYLDLLPSVLPINVPLENFRLSSPFGIRVHPIRKQLRFHTGVDVKAKSGMAVKATAKGVVSQVGFDPTLGAFVRLRHAFGFETVYGHLKGYCVKPGQLVAINQELGRVGQTGMTTGPHLHYVIKKNGSMIDPFQFCFLLRRRLWIYERSSPTGTGISVSASTN